jgi:hypothetical protein
MNIAIANQPGKSVLTEAQFLKLKEFLKPHPEQGSVQKHEYLMDKDNRMKDDFPAGTFLRVCHEHDTKTLELCIISGAGTLPFFREQLNDAQYQEILSEKGRVPDDVIKSIMLKVSIREPLHFFGKVLVKTYAVSKELPLPHLIILTKMAYPDKSIRYDIVVECEKDKKLWNEDILIDILDKNDVQKQSFPNRIDQLYGLEQHA